MPVALVHSAAVNKSEQRRVSGSALPPLALPLSLQTPAENKDEPVMNQQLEESIDFSLCSSNIPTAQPPAREDPPDSPVSSTPKQSVSSQAISANSRPTSATATRKALSLQLKSLTTANKPDTSISGPPVPRSKQSWLLRLFESKLFNMSLAITYLFNSKEQGVQVYIGESYCKFGQSVDYKPAQDALIVDRIKLSDVLSIAYKLNIP